MTTVSHRFTNVVAFVFCALFLLLAPTVQAHEYRPALLDVALSDDGAAEVLWRTEDSTVDSLIANDRAGSPAWALEPVFSPERCAATPATRHVHDRRTIERRWTLHCDPPGLHGVTLEIRGLAELPIETFVRIRWSEVSSTEFILRGTNNRATLEEPGTGPFGRGAALQAVFATYTWIGVEHILFGVDHLLFVLALLLLVPNGWMLVKTITGFTVGHSVTLSLAALGLLSLPGPPVEALIALSIALLAAEALRVGQRGELSLTSRRPWVVALSFGLLHGLGFAGALAELGLPPDRLPAALAAFNLGVELGQLAFVVAVVLAVGGVLRVLPRAERPLRVVTAWTIGIVSGYWFVERVAGFFA